MIFHSYKLDKIKNFYNLLQVIFKNKKYLTVAGLLACITFCTFIITTHKNTNVANSLSLQNKRAATILHELEDIQSVLHHIEGNPLNSKQEQTALRSLEKDMAIAQKNMADAAKVSDIQKLSSEISLVKDDIDTQINDLKKTISEPLGNKSFLEASALPFHVVSVDVISGEPYVSLEYGNHVSPLTVGDLLAEWRVISLDYELGTAEFINTKNQHVKVNVHGE